MSRSILNAKTLPASVTSSFFFSLNKRRSYAVKRGLLANLGDQGGPAQEQMRGKLEEPAVISDESGALSSWVPDPITGFYKPSHLADQIDPAELRAMALSHRIRTTL